MDQNIRDWDQGNAYQKAGVDTGLGESFAKKVGRLATTTYNSSVVEGVGGFAAVYRLDGERALVAATDGVGTKLKWAFHLDQHHTVGIDLVAMVANDLICTGARPLLFLDYYATSELQPQRGLSVVEGIVAGCKLAGMALIGGETAEMPGFYRQGEYDLAGFGVGEVKLEDLIDGERVAEGDQLIGLAASGFHSNGHSLLRKWFDRHETSEELKEQLLQPTRIYVQSILRLIKQFGSEVHGLAHITGGGLRNIARINSAWDYQLKLPPLEQRNPWMAQLLRERPEAQRMGWCQLHQTFNMGIGFVVAVSAGVDATKVIETLETMGERAWRIGEVSAARGSAGGKVLGIEAEESSLV